MILVPRNTPGIKLERPMLLLGYDLAPAGQHEVTFDNVRVPASRRNSREGRGFEIAQGRLGPRRIDHCMRAIGMAERSIELMVARAVNPFTGDLPTRAWSDATSRSRASRSTARLLTLHAAYMMDTVGNKAARSAIAQI